MIYTYFDVEVGDYVKVKDCDEGYLKVVSKNALDNSFNAVDDFGNEFSMERFNEITEIKLESEMDYAF